MQEVMAQVRNELGPDAIIVSSQNGKRGGLVKVIAAIDGDRRTPQPRSGGVAEKKPAAPPAPPSEGPSLATILQYHGVPRTLGQMLGQTANAMDADSPELALAAALDTSFRFLPILSSHRRPIMLAGAPGVGKTSVLAKLAARAALEGRRVRLFSTDTIRTGGIEQLAGYASLLGLEVVVAETPSDLGRAVSAAMASKPDLMLVDTAGINPFASDELARLQILARTIDAETIAVIAAGGDANEAADMAEGFARIGAQRFIATRLDAARRFGSIMSFAKAGPMAIAAVSATPYIGDGLQQINPVSLARLLMTPPARIAAQTSSSKNKLAAQ